MFTRIWFFRRKMDIWIRLILSIWIINFTDDLFSNEQSFYIFFFDGHSNIILAVEFYSYYSTYCLIFMFLYGKCSFLKFEIYIFLFFFVITVEMLLGLHGDNNNGVITDSSNIRYNLCNLKKSSILLCSIFTTPVQYS